MRDHITRQLELAAVAADAAERQARCTFVMVGAGYTAQSVAAALDDCVELSTGQKVPTRSLIWCVGVRPDALVGSLNLATNRGRLVASEFMAVPGADGIYACGDCAAVPGLTRPGQVTGMTAQHATRQGRLVARNVAASLGPATPSRTSTMTWASWSTQAGWPPPRTAADLARRALELTPATDPHALSCSVAAAQALPRDDQLGRRPHRRGARTVP